MLCSLGLKVDQFVTCLEDPGLTAQEVLAGIVALLEPGTFQGFALSAQIMCSLHLGLQA